MNRLDRGTTFNSGVWRTAPVRYGIAILSPIVATYLTMQFSSVLERTIFALFIAAVVLSTLQGGIGPGIVAIVISIVGCAYYVIPSYVGLDVTPMAGGQIFVFSIVGGVILVMASGRIREARRARTSERWLSTTLKSIGDAVIATDAAGRITFMNPIAQDLTGWTQKEAEGRPLADVFTIVNEATRQPAESPVNKVLEQGVIVGLANHTVLIARDGTEVPIEDSAAPIRNDEGEIHGVIMVFHDVSLRRRLEIEQQFLFESSEQLTSSLDYESTLARVASLAVPYIADWCAVDIVGDDGQLRRLATTHVDPEKVAWALELEERYPAASDAAAGLHNVIRTGRAELYADISDEMLRQEARDPEHLEVLRQVGFSSVMVVPLVAQGQTFGAITFVAAESGRHFDAASLVLAEEVGRHAATAVYNARLYRDAQRSAAEARAQARRLQVLADTTGALVEEQLDYTVVLESVARRIAETLGDTCVIRLLSEDGKTLDPVAIHAPDPEIRERMEAVLASTLLLADAGAIGRMIRTGEPIMMESVGPEMLAQIATPEHRSFLDVVPIHSLLIVPLRARGRAIGVLSVLRTRQAIPYVADDRSMLQDMADRAALVIDNARLFASAREQREWLEVTLSSIGDAVIATDAEGCITFMNDIARQLTAWGDESIGRKLADVFHILNEHTRQPVESPVDRVFRDGMIVGLANHTVLVAKDGTEHPIDDSAAPIRDAGGNLLGVVLVFHDITERKKIEDERGRLLAQLQQERQRLNDLFASVPGVVWEAWGEPDSPSQRIDYVSDYVEPMLGYSREEWFATPNFWLSIVHPDDRERAAARAARTFASQEGVGNNQFRWVARDGQVLWMDTRSVVIRGDDGKPLGLRGVTLDDTARKMAEQGLRESEERFRAMADSAPVLIWISGTDGLRSYFNKGWLEFTGRTFEQEYGDGWAEGVHPDDIARCLETSLGSFNARREFRMEYRLRRADGEYRWLLDSGVPRFTPDGTFLGFIGSCVDIHDRRLIEDELKKAKEVAEAASSAKDQFLAVLSHELRTPLTPVLAVAQALEAEESLPEEIRPFVEIIRRNVELEVNLIDDLLDLVRVARGKMRMTIEREDIHALVRNVLEICRTEIAEKRFDLEVALHARRHYAHVDAARLQQVFWNLIKNAVKFTPEGGSIIVRSFDDDAGGLRVEVADTGIGIEPDVLPRIFNVFEQGEQSVTRRFGGLGLGLAISQALMDLQGGAISVTSPGRDLGATFAVSLPKAEAEEPRDGRSDGSADGTPENSGLRILLVDDHQDTNNVMRLLLERKGYAVTAAYSVESALRAAARQEFDLLVSDIGLPDGTGIDLIESLRQRGVAPVKAIALSGFGMESDIQRSLQAGFAEHLIKPISFGKLHEAIQRVAS